MKLIKAMLVLGLLTTTCYAGIVKDILFDIRMEADKCTVLYVSISDENKILGSKSICSTYQIHSPRKASIKIYGEWYTAIIKESKYSDGGDLDNLKIINKSGRVVASRTNVPSCGNIIFALSDGREFTKITISE